MITKTISIALLLYPSLGLELAQWRS